MHELPENLTRLLDTCRERQASDLHVSVDAAPMLRVDGDLEALPESELGVAAIDATLATLSQAQREAFAASGNLDFGCSHASERFRFNVYRERGNPALSVRRLASRIPELSELGLPPQVAELATLSEGLVLFTGPTGSGKSTSLAALLQAINQQRRCHILTIEDPVEYLHANARSLVHQRELHTDVASFAEALRSALREDPDVILVGEMRDLPTMRAALTAAETGHLVFSTLHCADAVGALDRILALYPAAEQEAVRRQLAMALRAIVGQRLLQARQGPGRVPVVELLRNTSAVANLVRSGEFKQIYNVLETGAGDGMQSFDMALAALAGERVLDHATAEPHVRNHSFFRERVRLRAPISRQG